MRNCSAIIDMIKFFVKPEDVSGAHVYIEDREDVKHLSKVLRAKVGDSVMISDGDEWEYGTVIESIEQDLVTLRIQDRQRFATEPSTRVTLYQGVPKGTKMETVIQKCVEMGVDSIVPVFMERTVVVEKGNFSRKLERWQRISDEAVKQCKRGKIPEVRAALSFKEMLSDIESANYDMVILPYESEDNRTIKDALVAYCTGVAKAACSGRGLSSLQSSTPLPLASASQIDVGAEACNGVAKAAYSSKIAVIIGPEGGFSEEEISMAKERDYEIVTLGKTTLRTETAGMAALAMIMYELEL